jgi:hypothetical protein
MHPRVARGTVHVDREICLVGPIQTIYFFTRRGKKVKEKLTVGRIVNPVAAVR